VWYKGDHTTDTAYGYKHLCAKKFQQAGGSSEKATEINMWL